MNYKLTKCGIGFLMQVLCLLSPLYLYAQNGVVKGKVVDALDGAPIEFASIYIKGTNNVTESDRFGQFALKTDSLGEVHLIASRIGYDAQTQVIDLADSLSKNIVFALEPGKSDIEVVVKTSELEDARAIKEDVEEFAYLPSTTGNVESILPSIALGVSVSAAGELSSQYNVRGGNYDENLVYVNDFEIYRPQLVRSGQQEGLSFPNADLMKSLTFSSGGFAPLYGDKMSSVMDIRYKIPDSLKGSFSASFLGASAHVEGKWQPDKNNGNKAFRYLVGARYKTTAYLLNSLDVKGEYVPDFYDLQSFLTYDFNSEWQVGALINYNHSKYTFEPVESSTAFGLIDFALRLNTSFEGAELTTFSNHHLGGYLRYLPKSKERGPKTYYKLLAAEYQSDESETFDIIGAYRLSQIETDLGADDFGREVAVLGDGTQQAFGRNFLDMKVRYLRFLSGMQWKVSSRQSHLLEYGFMARQELINDQLKEWERLDSAGYSLPYDPNAVLINDYIRSENDLESYRYTAFVQDRMEWSNGIEEIQWVFGLRAAYWSLNREWNVSPRTQLIFRSDNIHPHMTFKLAGGVYVQPPLYRELRRQDGDLNRQLEAQKSWQVLAGWNYDFKMFQMESPFRLIIEAYYKRLWDIVPYEFDNVRIRYNGENEAEGYILGLDARINGEFVPGVESWINFSLLSAKENIIGVQHKDRQIGDSLASNVNYVSRPTERPFSLSMFFQDYLPMNERFKTHVLLTVSSGLPFGVRDNNRIFRNVYRQKMYQRVDIGFSYQLWDKKLRAQKPEHMFRFFDDVWLSLEVFNLLQIQNEASNTWIKTIINQQFAVPNYLTSRRINLRLRAAF